MEDIKPTTPQQSGPPVNDITAPLPAPVGVKFEESDNTSSTAPATPTESPAVSPEPSATPEAEPAEEPKSESGEENKEEAKPAEQPQAKVPKKHGAGLAIFAAIIIVLGLGAMFTYAYLQTQ